MRAQKFRWLLQTGITLAAMAVLTGCVERRYTLRTDPPGALAIVNGDEIGTTPVSRSFYYYGDREITFILDEHETRTIIQPINAPWWDNLLTEFFTENLIPFTMRDERTYQYDLRRTDMSDAKDLLERAEKLRSEANVQLPPRRSGILGWLGFS